MLSICFKEGIKIPPDVLSQLIVSANQDVRQTLNLLSMWAVDPSRTDAERLRKDAQTTKKDVKLVCLIIYFSLTVGKITLATLKMNVIMCFDRTFFFN